jgi:hypothetical protein
MVQHCSTSLIAFSDLGLIMLVLESWLLLLTDSPERN